ncbi:MAG: flavin monoamine oxidase family protein [Acidimicrobiales bacterium]
MTPATTHDYDVVVVGGGIGGAYMAWRALTGAPGPGTTLPPVGSRRVLLLESSDRIGGRLLSLSAPGAPGVVGEFGGMGYTDANTLVSALVKQFQLPTKPLQRAGADNLLYLRGVHFKHSQATDPSTVPFRLGPKEEGKPPGALVPEAVWNAFGPASKSWTSAQWWAAVEQATVDGLPMHEVGWRNFLTTQLTNEGLAWAEASTGHHFQVGNWNCAAAIPWYLGDGNAAYHMVADGYDTIPISLANSVASVPGGALRMQTPVSSVQPLAGGGMQVTGPGLSATAARVVLALPRRALELLDLGTPGAIPQPLLDTVTGQKVMKIFLAYDRPWWKSAGITGGSSVTDLPMSSCWYVGDDPTSGGSLLMASYNDTLATNYWEGLMAGPTFSRGSAPTPNPLGPASGGWRQRRPSQALVDDLHRQVVELHSPVVGAIPAPYDAAIQDWSADPFGGAFYTWNVGAPAPAVADQMLWPNPALPLHVVGSAYSLDQGWAEGALATAEQVAQRHLGLLAFS